MGKAENIEDRQDKKVYIEFLRIAACFLVLVNHTNSSIFLNLTPGRTWFCSVTYFFISKIAVPLFLFIMGGLLLEKEDSPKKTAERLIRMLVVLVIGSFCYYVYYTWRYGTAFSIVEFFLNLPKTYVTNAYWYLYLYLGLLCMLSILQKLVKALNKRQMEYFLFFSLGVLGTVPLISCFVPSFSVSDYFTNGLIGPYVGQVLLGYYIERYVPLTKKVFWGCFCGFILLIAAQVAGTFWLYLQNPASYLALDNRTFITITGAAACFYICVKYIFVKYPAPQKLEWLFCHVGALTFGIYLLGDMMIAESNPIYSTLCAHTHQMIAMVFWELYIFIACALIVDVVRQIIPPLRKFL